MAKIQGEFTQTLANLSEVLPVQVIDPGVHKLVEDSAFRRRRWMDWATFHVEHGFVDVWANYTRTLKQRNAALKQLLASGAAGSPQLAAWDIELAQLGETPGAVAPAHARGPATPLAGDRPRPVRSETGAGYFQGWARDSTLATALADLPRTGPGPRQHPGRASPWRCAIETRWQARPRHPVPRPAEAGGRVHDPGAAAVVDAAFCPSLPRCCWMIPRPNSIPIGSGPSSARSLRCAASWS